jgi:hypothetical protein
MRAKAGCQSSRHMRQAHNPPKTGGGMSTIFISPSCSNTDFGVADLPVPPTRPLSRLPARPSTTYQQHVSGILLVTLTRGPSEP